MRKIIALLVVVVCASFSVEAQGLATFQEIRDVAKSNKSKRPVIVVPGILGSELVNKHSGEKVWFSVRRSKDDDLRLPIAPTLAASRDNLIPGDILRSIRFLFSTQDYYGGVTKVLQEQGGYSEESFAKPPKSLKNKYFVFAYDWRRDNVENARILIKKIKALKAATGEKNIKFDLVAHSMGGLIARYAAMYGDRDIPNGTPRPNWAGGHHIEKILMFGTPNHGSADSLQVLLEGFGAIPGINLPFVRDLSPAEVFTMPALFQLLPHSEETMFYDENLKPIKADLYDYKTWEKFGWSIYGDKSLLTDASNSEIARMEIHLENALLRAKKFQEAIDSNRKGLVGLYAFGSQCEDTLSAYILRKEADGIKWKLISKPTAYTTADGKSVDPTSMREVMYAPGDGRVVKKSLTPDMLNVSETYFTCSKHDALFSNEQVQRRMLSNLIGIGAK